MLWNLYRSLFVNALLPYMVQLVHAASLSEFSLVYFVSL